jgi:hypothetical protein
VKIPNTINSLGEEIASEEIRGPQRSKSNHFLLVNPPSSVCNGRCAYPQNQERSSSPGTLISDSLVDNLLLERRCLQRRCSFNAAVE